MTMSASVGPWGLGKLGSMKPAPVGWPMMSKRCEWLDGGEVGEDGEVNGVRCLGYWGSGRSWFVSMEVNLRVCQSEMGCSASRQVFRSCLLCMYSIINSSSTVIVDTEVPRLVSYRRRQYLGTTARDPFLAVA
jgi:hypothetical protein